MSDQHLVEIFRKEAKRDLRYIWAYALLGLVCAAVAVFSLMARAWLNATLMLCWVAFDVYQVRTIRQNRRQALRWVAEYSA